MCIFRKSYGKIDDDAEAEASSSTEAGGGGGGCGAVTSCLCKVWKAVVFILTPEFSTPTNEEGADAFEPEFKRSPVSFENTFIKV